MTSAIVSLVDDLAGSGGGWFTAADALARGLTRDHLTSLTRSGVVTRLARGCYARRTTSLTPEAAHAQRTTAVLRLLDHRALASHHSALVLRGLPTYRVDLTRVHVTHTTSSSHRRLEGWTVHQRDVSTSGRTDRRADPMDGLTVPVALPSYRVGFFGGRALSLLQGTLRSAPAR